MPDKFNPVPPEPDKTDNVEIMEREAEQMLEVRYITRENAVFSATPGGFVSLDFDGEHYDRVAVYRAFPFTSPDLYISIRHPDAKAAEIGLIRDLRELSKETQELLRAQINLRYFTPKIEKVTSIREEYGYSYWDVLTDRGACRFTVEQGGVVRLGERRLIISDIDGNRFELPDVLALSSRELKMIDLYI